MTEDNVFISLTTLVQLIILLLPFNLGIRYMKFVKIPSKRKIHNRCSLKRCRFYSHFFLSLKDNTSH